MNQWNLVDLHTIGGLFTWRKNIQNGGHVRKRLDRCMVEIDWQMKFPHALVEVLPPPNSNHNPLLLSCRKFQSRKTHQFRFQAAWIDHPDYGKLVEETWTSSDGNAVMKAEKIQLKSIIFNKDVFGNIFTKKRRLEARIKGVHRQLDLFPYSDLIIMKRELQKQYDEVLHQEELLWYQKSREN